MIESVIEFSCRNRLIVILAFVVLAGVGVWVVAHTPVDAIPDLSENQVIVFTDWMGRSPKEIEDQITYPLSVNLQGLAGVKAVRSSSEFNFSMINIIFEDSVDFYFARTRVLERLALASTFLPQGVVPYLAPDATALGQIFWYTVEGKDRDLGELRAIQDWYVRYQLNSVPGVAQVSSVGGFPREYQVDVTPERMRAYNVTLGDIYQAIARSNGAVGGRVVQKGNAEYIIRGVGWIRGLEDIRKTVVTTRDGVPVLVEHVASVQMGSEFRRSVLEKDGREVTGGVVMMRYGGNPLEVTRLVKEKIRDLQKGLPEGVRIVPFYDRTRLIEGAIHTVTKVLEHEVLIATIAILLILLHFRSVLVVVVTLPLSVAVAFILMRVLGISSNIMSLSGIAISIGILVDQAIVMLENATHRLSAQFGPAPIKGDTTEIVVAACRQVGRPIFFSVVIMVISFLPVFALTGQEGKLFHPLAFTKTFALIGTALISITLVPALIPLLVRGRLSKEENNWIVRSVAEVYRPMLRFLMHRPKTVIWLFVILVALGGFFARHMGREFMPPIDEGSIMDMPVTAPRASVTEVADDIKARDALMRAMPEVEMVTGKAGRADTPTDPAPLDMLETVVNLHPKSLWIKRGVKLADALAEADRMVGVLETTGSLEPFSDAAARKDFVAAVANGALERFDASMRPEVANRLMEYQQERAARSVGFITAAASTRVMTNAIWTKVPSDDDMQRLLATLTERYSEVFHYDPQVYDVESVVAAFLAELTAQGFLPEEHGAALAPAATWREQWLAPLAESLGGVGQDFTQETAAALVKARDEEDAKWAHETNLALFDVAMDRLANSLYAAAASEAGMRSLWKPKGQIAPPDTLAKEMGRAGVPMGED